jgi:uncharacterized protein (DUF58 family)
MCLPLLVPLLAAITFAPMLQLAAGQPIAVGPFVAYAVILVLTLGFLEWYFRSIRDTMIREAPDQRRLVNSAKPRR